MLESDITSLLLMRADDVESNPGSDYSLHRGREYEKLIQMR